MKRKFTNRNLRIEDLERREMLSVAPITPAESIETAAALNTDDFSAAVIDLGDIVTEEQPVTFAPTAAANKYTATWDAVDGAVTYNVQICRNFGAVADEETGEGGEIWTSYKKGVAETSLDVNGLYAGRDYGLKIFAVNAEGKSFGEPVVGQLSPIGLKATDLTFSQGDTLSVKLLGTDNASAKIQWFSLQEDSQEVEIEEAAGQLKYTPDSAFYDIKVVATGTGVSNGSVSELVFSSSDYFTAEYNADTRVATLEWAPEDGAASYKVRIFKTPSGGDEPIWIDYRKTTEPKATLNGLYVGKSYDYAIYAYDADGNVLSVHNKTLTPISATSNAEDFLTGYEEGDVLTVTVNGKQGATYEVKWYVVDPNEGTETLIGSASNKTSLKVTKEIAESGAYIKSVVTGTRESQGCNFEFEYIGKVETPTNFKVASFEDGVLTLTWDDQAAEENYFLTINDGVAIKLDANTTEYVIENVEAGNYTFALTAANKVFTSDAAEATFTTATIALNTDVYAPGDTLTAALTPTDATPTIKWYGQDGKWVPIEGETSEAISTAAAEKYSSVTREQTADGYQWYGFEENEFAEIAALAGKTSVNVDDYPEIVTFKVVATGEFDETSEAIAKLGVTSRPSGFQLGSPAYADGKVNLVWTDQQYEAGYALTVMKDGEFLEIVDDIDKDAESFAYGPIAQGSVYTFAITAKNARGGESANPVEFATSLVTLDKATYNPGDTLTASEAASYVWYGLDETVVGDPWVKIDDATGASYTVDDKYAAVKVVATGEYGETSEATATLSDVAKPENFAVAYDPETGATLTWTDQDAETSYALKITNDKDNSLKAYDIPANTTEYVPANFEVKAGYTYTFSLVAKNAKGESAAATCELTAVEVTLPETFNAGATLTAVANVEGATFEWLGLDSTVPAGVNPWVALTGETTASLNTGDYPQYAGFKVVATGLYGETDSAISELDSVAEVKLVAVEGSYDEEAGAILVKWDNDTNVTKYSLTINGEAVENFNYRTGLDGKAEFACPVDADKVNTIVLTAENAAGSTTSSVDVALATVQLNAATYAPDGTLTASLTLAGASATYKWYGYKAGVETGELIAEGNVLKVGENGELANYVKVEVEATGKYGEVTSAAADLAKVADPTLNIVGYSDADKAVTLDWAKVDNATGYTLTVAIDDAEAQIIPNFSFDVVAGRPTFVYNGVVPGKTYTFTLTASNAAGDCANPSTVTFATSVVSLKDKAENGSDVDRYAPGDTIYAAQSAAGVTASYAWEVQGPGKWVDIEGETAEKLSEDAYADYSYVRRQGEPGAYQWQGYEDAPWTPIDLTADHITIAGDLANVVAVKVIATGSYGEQTEDIAKLGEAVAASALEVQADSYDGENITLKWKDVDYEASYVLSVVVTDNATGLKTQMEPVTIGQNVESATYPVNYGATYAFTLISVNARDEVATVPAVDFALAQVVLDSETYVVGQTLIASLTSDKAAATYEWYGIPANGVETEGDGLLGTGETLEITSDIVDKYSKIRVVATDASVTKGEEAVTTYAEATLVDVDVVLQLGDYNVEENALGLKWNYDENVTSYGLLVNGEKFEGEFEYKTTGLGSTDALFAFLDVVPGENYTFQIVAEVGGTMEVSNVVEFKTAIVTGLNDTTYVEGTELTATTKGGADISFQWQTSADGANWVDIADATAQTYVVSEDAAAASYIQVVATDANGIETKAQASLNEVAAPTEFAVDEYKAATDEASASVLLGWKYVDGVKYDLTVKVGEGDEAVETTYEDIEVRTGLDGRAEYTYADVQDGVTYEFSLVARQKATSDPATVKFASSKVVLDSEVFAANDTLTASLTSDVAGETTYAWYGMVPGEWVAIEGQTSEKLDASVIGDSYSAVKREVTDEGYQWYGYVDPHYLEDAIGSEATIVAPDGYVELKVVATGAYGETSEAVAALGEIAAPSNLTITDFDLLVGSEKVEGEVTLTWTDVAYESEFVLNVTITDAEGNVTIDTVEDIAQFTPSEENPDAVPTTTYQVEAGYTYAFTLTAKNAGGEATEEAPVTFAIATVELNAEEYVPGFELKATTLDKSATLAWVGIDAEGVETVIEGATTDSYTVTTADAMVYTQIKAVATDAFNNKFEDVASLKATAKPEGFKVNGYDAEQGKVALVWNDQDAETEYLLKVDGKPVLGFTYETTGFGDEVTCIYSYPVEAGTTYTFELVATNAAGESEAAEATFTSAVVTLDVDGTDDESTFVPGDTINAVLTVDPKTVQSILWYGYDDAGQTALNPNEGGTSVTIDEDAVYNKVEVRVVGQYGEYTSAEIVRDVVATPTEFKVVSYADGFVNLSWLFNDGNTYELYVNGEPAAFAGEGYKVNGTVENPGVDPVYCTGLYAVEAGKAYTFELVAVDAKNVKSDPATTSANIVDVKLGAFVEGEEGEDPVFVAKSFYGLGEVVPAVLTPSDASVTYQWYGVVPAAWEQIDDAFINEDGSVKYAELVDGDGNALYQQITSEGGVWLGLVAEHEEKIDGETGATLEITKAIANDYLSVRVEATGVEADGSYGVVSATAELGEVAAPLDFAVESYADGVVTLTWTDVDYESNYILVVSSEFGLIEDLITLDPSASGTVSYEYEVTEGAGYRFTLSAVNAQSVATTAAVEFATAEVYVEDGYFVENQELKAELTSEFASATYQWFGGVAGADGNIVWTALDGANKATYTVKPEDVVNFTRLKVEATDAHENYTVDGAPIVTSAEVVRATIGQPTIVEVVYNDGQTSATLYVTEAANATKYFLTNNGATNEDVTSQLIDPETGAFIVAKTVDGVALGAVTVDNIAPGKNYSFELVATDGGDVKVNSELYFVALAKVALDSADYGVGTTLGTTFTTEEASLTGYVWYGQNAETGDWAAIEGATASSYAVTFDDAVTYSAIGVVATGSYGETSWAQASLREAEAPVVKVKAKADEDGSLTSATLSWAAVENATSYAVYVNGELVETVETTKYVVDVEQGAEYTFQVVSVNAVNLDGAVGKSKEVFFTSALLSDLELQDFVPVVEDGHDVLWVCNNKKEPYADADGNYFECYKGEDGKYYAIGAVEGEDEPLTSITDANGVVITIDADHVTPAEELADVSVYKEGTIISAVLTSDEADASYQWYGYVGEIWEDIEGANGASLDPQALAGKDYVSIRQVEKEVPVVVNGDETDETTTITQWQGLLPTSYEEIDGADKSILIVTEEMAKKYPKIKVVATGKYGETSEEIVNKALAPVVIGFDYTPATSATETQEAAPNFVVVSWTDVGAESYALTMNGEAVDLSEVEPVDGKYSVKIENVEAGKDYVFAVTAYDDLNNSETTEETFALVSVSLNRKSYKEGQKLVATPTTSYDAIRWVGTKLDGTTERIKIDGLWARSETLEITHDLIAKYKSIAIELTGAYGEKATAEAKLTKPAAPEASVVKFTQNTQTTTDGTVTLLNSGRVYLGFDAVPNTTSYKITVTENGGQPTTWSITPVVDTENDRLVYAVSVEAGVDYTFVIQAVNAAGDSTVTDEVKVDYAIGVVDLVREEGNLVATMTSELANTEGAQYAWTGYIIQEPGVWVPYNEADAVAGKYMVDEDTHEIVTKTEQVAGQEPQVYAMTGEYQEEVELTTGFTSQSSMPLSAVEGVYDKVKVVAIDGYGAQTTDEYVFGAVVKPTITSTLDSFNPVDMTFTLKTEKDEQATTYEFKSSGNDVEDKEHWYDITATANVSDGDSYDFTVTTANYKNHEISDVFEFDLATCGVIYGVGTSETAWIPDREAEGYAWYAYDSAKSEWRQFEGEKYSYDVTNGGVVVNTVTLTQFKYGDVENFFDTYAAICYAKQSADGVDVAYFSKLAAVDSIPNVTLTSAEGSYTLNWVDNDANVTSYVVTITHQTGVDVNGAPVFETLPPVKVTGTSYTGNAANGYVDGDFYKFTVAAANGAGVGNASDETSIKAVTLCSDIGRTTPADEFAYGGFLCADVNYNDLTGNDVTYTWYGLKSAVVTSNGKPITATTFNFAAVDNLELFDTNSFKYDETEGVWYGTKAFNLNVNGNDNSWIYIDEARAAYPAIKVVASVTDDEDNTIFTSEARASQVVVKEASVEVASYVYDNVYPYDHGTATLDIAAPNASSTTLTYTNGTEAWSVAVTTTTTEGETTTTTLYDHEPTAVDLAALNIPEGVEPVITATGKDYVYTADIVNGKATIDVTPGSTYVFTLSAANVVMDEPVVVTTSFTPMYFELSNGNDENVAAGDTLAVDTSSLPVDPASVVWTWYGSDDYSWFVIDGETGSTLDVTDEMMAKYIRFRVTGTATTTKPAAEEGADPEVVTALQGEYTVRTADVVEPTKPTDVKVASYDATGNKATITWTADPNSPLAKLAATGYTTTEYLLQSLDSSKPNYFKVENGVASYEHNFANLEEGMAYTFKVANGNAVDRYSEYSDPATFTALNLTFGGTYTPAQIEKGLKTTVDGEATGYAWYGAKTEWQNVTKTEQKVVNGETVTVPVPMVDGKFVVDETKLDGVEVIGDLVQGEDGVYALVVSSWTAIDADDYFRVTVTVTTPAENEDEEPTTETVTKLDYTQIHDADVNEDGIADLASEYGAIKVIVKDADPSAGGTSVYAIATLEEIVNAPSVTVTPVDRGVVEVGNHKYQDATKQVTVSWTADELATSYVVKVGEETVEYKPVTEKTNPTDGSEPEEVIVGYAATIAVTAGNTYDVTVTALNGAGEKATSKAVTTVDAKVKVDGSTATPKNSTTFVPGDRLVVSATGDEDGYSYEWYGKKTADSAWEFVEGGMTLTIEDQTSQQPRLPNKLLYSEFRCVVRGKTAQGAVDPNSTVDTITAKLVAVADAPVIKVDKFEPAVVGGTVTIGWAAVENAVGYELIVTEDGVAQDPKWVSPTVDTTSGRLTTTVEIGEGDYSFELVAMNAAGKKTSEAVEFAALDIELRDDSEAEKLYVAPVTQYNGLAGATYAWTGYVTQVASGENDWVPYDPAKDNGATTPSAATRGDFSLDVIEGFGTENEADATTKIYSVYQKDDNGTITRTIQVGDGEPQVQAKLAGFTYVEPIAATGDSLTYAEVANYARVKVDVTDVWGDTDSDQYTFQAPGVPKITSDLDDFDPINNVFNLEAEADYVDPEHGFTYSGAGVVGSQIKNLGSDDYYDKIDVTASNPRGYNTDEDAFEVKVAKATTYSVVNEESKFTADLVMVEQEDTEAEPVVDDAYAWYYYADGKWTAFTEGVTTADGVTTLDNSAVKSGYAAVCYAKAVANEGVYVAALYELAHVEKPVVTLGCTNDDYTLTWEPQPQAAGYKVAITTPVANPGEGEPTEVVETVDVTGTTYSAKLEAGVSYKFTVTAINAAGESEESDELTLKTVTLDSDTYGAPRTTLTANADYNGQTVTYTWYGVVKHEQEELKHNGEAITDETLVFDDDHIDNFDKFDTTKFVYNEDEHKWYGTQKDERTQFDSRSDINYLIIADNRLNYPYVTVVATSADGKFTSEATAAQAAVTTAKIDVTNYVYDNSDPYNKGVVTLSLDAPNSATRTVTYTDGEKDADTNELIWKTTGISYSADGKTATVNVNTGKSYTFKLTADNAVTDDVVEDTVNFTPFTFGLDGTFAAGQTLKADVDDASGMTWTWYGSDDHNWYVITGETGSELAVTDELMAKYVRIRATGSAELTTVDVDGENYVGGTYSVRSDDLVAPMEAKITSFSYDAAAGTATVKWVYDPNAPVVNLVAKGFAPTTYHLLNKTGETTDGEPTTTGYIITEKVGADDRYGYFTVADEDVNGVTTKVATYTHTGLIAGMTYEFKYANSNGKTWTGANQAGDPVYSDAVSFTALTVAFPSATYSVADIADGITPTVVGTPGTYTWYGIGADDSETPIVNTATAKYFAVTPGQNGAPDIVDYTTIKDVDGKLASTYKAIKVVVTDGDARATGTGATVSATTSLVDPAAPTEVKVEAVAVTPATGETPAATNRATVTWKAAENATSYVISGAETDGGQTYNAESGEYSQKIKVAPGQTYDVVVTAKNGANGTPAAKVTFKTIDAKFKTGANSTAETTSFRPGDTLNVTPESNATYQWYGGKEVVENNQTKMVWTAVTGATGKSYPVPTGTDAQYTAYRCVVTGNATAYNDTVDVVEANISQMGDPQVTFKTYVADTNILTVNLVKADGAASNVLTVKKGDATLTAGTDYTVSEDGKTCTISGLEEGSVYTFTYVASCPGESDKTATYKYQRVGDVELTQNKVEDGVVTEVKASIGEGVAQSVEWTATFTRVLMANTETALNELKGSDAYRGYHFAGQTYVTVVDDQVKYCDTYTGSEKFTQAINNANTATLPLAKDGGYTSVVAKVVGGTNSESKVDSSDSTATSNTLVLSTLTAPEVEVDFSTYGPVSDDATVKIAAQAGADSTTATIGEDSTELTKVEGNWTATFDAVGEQTIVATVSNAAFTGDAGSKSTEVKVFAPTAGQSGGLDVVDDKLGKGAQIKPYGTVSVGASYQWFGYKTTITSDAGGQNATTTSEWVPITGASGTITAGTSTTPADNGYLTVTDQIVKDYSYVKVVTTAAAEGNTPKTYTVGVKNLADVYVPIAVSITEEVAEGAQPDGFTIGETLTAKTEAGEIGSYQWVGNVPEHTVVLEGLTGDPTIAQVIAALGGENSNEAKNMEDGSLKKTDGVWTVDIKEYQENIAGATGATLTISAESGYARKYDKIKVTAFGQVNSKSANGEATSEWVGAAAIKPAITFVPNSYEVWSGGTIHDSNHLATIVSVYNPQTQQYEEKVDNADSIYSYYWLNDTIPNLATIQVKISGLEAAADVTLTYSGFKTQVNNEGATPTIEVVSVTNELVTTIEDGIATINEIIPGNTYTFTVTAKNAKETQSASFVFKPILVDVHAEGHTADRFFNPRENLTATVTSESTNAIWYTWQGTNSEDYLTDGRVWVAVDKDGKAKKDGDTSFVAADGSGADFASITTSGEFKYYRVLASEINSTEGYYGTSSYMFAQVAWAAAPTNLTMTGYTDNVSGDNGQVTLKWKGSDTADHYEVYSGNVKLGDDIANVMDANGYVTANVPVDAGGVYEFTVKAVNMSGSAQTTLGTWTTPTDPDEQSELVPTVVKTVKATFVDDLDQPITKCNLNDVLGETVKLEITGNEDAEVKWSGIKKDNTEVPFDAAPTAFDFATYKAYKVKATGKVLSNADDTSEATITLNAPKVATPTLTYVPASVTEQSTTPAALNVDWTGTGANATEYVVSVNGTEFKVITDGSTSCSVPVDSNLTDDGKITVKVTAVNVAGNAVPGENETDTAVYKQAKITFVGQYDGAATEADALTNNAFKADYTGGQVPIAKLNVKSNITSTFYVYGSEDGINWPDPGAPTTSVLVDASGESCDLPIPAAAANYKAFKIRAVGNDGTDNGTAYVSGTVVETIVTVAAPETPKNVTLTSTPVSGGGDSVSSLTATWDAQSDAQSYRVVRTNYKNGEYNATTTYDVVGGATRQDMSVTTIDAQGNVYTNDIEVYAVNAGGDSVPVKLSFAPALATLNKYGYSADDTLTVTVPTALANLEPTYQWYAYTTITTTTEGLDGPVSHTTDPGYVKIEGANTATLDLSATPKIQGSSDYLKLKCVVTWSNGAGQTEVEAFAQPQVAGDTYRFESGADNYPTLVDTLSWTNPGDGYSYSYATTPAPEGVAYGDIDTVSTPATGAVDTTLARNNDMTVEIVAKSSDAVDAVEIGTLSKSTYHFDNQTVFATNTYQNTTLDGTETVNTVMMLKKTNATEEGAKMYVEFGDGVTFTWFELKEVAGDTTTYEWSVASGAMAQHRCEGFRQLICVAKDGDTYYVGWTGNGDGTSGSDPSVYTGFDTLEATLAKTVPAPQESGSVLDEAFAELFEEFED